MFGVGLRWGGDGATPTGGDRTYPTPQIDRSTLEKIWGLEFDLITTPAEPNEPTDEPLNPTQGNGLEESEQRFTPANLSREQALKLISGLRARLNQTQIIELLWCCKKGGSAAWKAAYSEFKSLREGE